MCPRGVTCLPTHLFSLLDTNNFISEGGRGAWDFFLCLLVVYISYVIDASRGVPKVKTDRTHTPPFSEKSQVTNVNDDIDLHIFV